MRNKLLLLFFASMFSTTISFSQKCGTNENYFEEQMKKYPEYYKKLAQKNKHLKDAHDEALKNLPRFKNTATKKIIPVVVHNIYNDEGGFISEAEIHAAIDALNKNFNGQSDKLLEKYQNKYIKTPDIFAAVRGVANIEFRLAKWTPGHDGADGSPRQPTNGINRVYSDITSPGSGGPDPVKTLAYWNSYEYFNIWTVRQFAQPGLLGYAQFPPNPESGFPDFMSTDGVVILASEFRNAASSTMTHEAGHWLGLRHIWGDATCGDDGINDTPVHRYDNNGASTSSPTPSGHPRPTPALFPYHVGIPAPPGQSGAWGCVADSLNPAGEMFMNYMDYTQDAYTTMFSAGQIEKVNTVLEGEVDEDTGELGIGSRFYIWQDKNIEATGTSNGFINVEEDCNVDYDFYVKLDRNFVCEGTELHFVSNSEYIDLPVTSAIWNFDDGSGDIVSDYIPVPNTGYNKKHTYSESGEYSVTFTVEYEQTRQVRVADEDDIIDGYDGNIEEETNTIIVQGSLEELLDMGAYDIELHIDSHGYSLSSYLIKDELTTDNIQDATMIDTIQNDSILSIVIYVDSTSLSQDDIDMLANADTSWSEDVIFGADTVRTYYGQYLYYTYDGYYADTLFYRGNFDETYYVAQYVSSCTSVKVKENIVTIGKQEGESNDDGFMYSFENSDDLVDDWTLMNNQEEDIQWSLNNSDNATWMWTDKAARDGSGSIMIDGEFLSTGEDVIMLTTEAYDLTVFEGTPYLSFSWSGAASNTNPLNELKVEYSTSCGRLWSPLVTISEYESANAGMYPSSRFVPEENQWRDTMITKSGLENNNVMFKFSYVVSGSSNNFYLDRIMIGEENDLIQSQSLQAKLSLYPNPSKGKPAISIYDCNGMNVQVNLVSILGNEVTELYSGDITNNIQTLDNLDWPKNLKRGVYFITAVHNGQIITTEKLILNK